MNILTDPTARPLIAHRGASAEAPENTLAAFQRAADLRVDAFEFDVRLTADGLVVVHHDPTLDRTTPLTGPVRARTLAELRAATAVPTLDEVLGAFPTMPVLIELKEVEGQEKVRDVILRHGAANRAVVASEHHDALACFRDGRFLVGASRKDILRGVIRAALRIRSRRVDCRAYSVPVRHGAIPVVTRRFIADAHAVGVPVHIWTVDDPTEAARLRALGANGILTNDPAGLARFGIVTGWPHGHP